MDMTVLIWAGNIWTELMEVCQNVQDWYRLADIKLVNILWSYIDFEYIYYVSFYFKNLIKLAPPVISNPFSTSYLYS